ncbi:hypothetical protein R1flu_006725 [Riccia fluitans]|uniref:Uncharacterized protein n=1 Tax=Riccia fluitans TaxID=41844 RepID=A0ABD1YWV1_9MARC
MATLPTSCGMIDPHLGSVVITSVALSDSCGSSCGSPPKTFNMRDLLNAARKTPSGNGSSVMLQPSGSKKRIEKNVSTGSRHKMNRKEYEMIMRYLEDPEHLVDILGSGRKTKVSGKHPSKQTAFGVMAVHLASLGFPVCTGAIMQKRCSASDLFGSATDFPCLTEAQAPTVLLDPMDLPMPMGLMYTEIL